MNLFTRAYISMVTRRDAFLESLHEEKSLREDERGVAPIVATILILLIVILMVAVFYKQISGWFSEMMAKIFGTGGTNAGSMNTSDFGGTN